MESSLKISLVILMKFVCKPCESISDGVLFRDTVKSGHYVDKTNFIKYFHDLDGPAYASAPRLFGKTLAISTLRAFYGVDTTSKSDSSKISSPNYKAFSTLAGKPKLNDTIFEDRSFFASHFATRPVLFLSFKSLSVSSKKALLSSLEALILEAYKTHDYVLSSKNLTPHDRKMFNFYCNTTKIKTEIDLVDAGQTLTGILFRYFSKQCLLLVDDFDAPALKFLLIPSTGGKRLDAGVFQVLDKLTGALLKDNWAVFKTLLVGVTGLAKEYLKQAGNVHHLSFSQQPEVARFFAFNEQEVKQVCTKDLKVVTLQHGGFRAKEGEALFNPFSVLKCLDVQDSKVLSWWATDYASKFDLELAMTRNDEIWKFVADAYVGDGVLVSAKAKYSIVALRRILNGDVEETLSDEQRDILGYYLWDLGICTFSKILSAAVRLVVPNLEVRKQLSEIFARNPFL